MPGEHRGVLARDAAQPADGTGRAAQVAPVVCPQPGRQAVDQRRVEGTVEGQLARRRAEIGQQSPVLDEVRSGRSGGRKKGNFGP